MYQQLEDLEFVNVLFKSSGLLPDKKSNAAAREKHTLPNVLNFLSSTYRQLTKTGLSQPNLNLLFAQIFYFMNSSLFNHLLEKPELCKASTGFTIKMIVSQIEEWASQKHPVLLPFVRSQFDNLMEAANVLVIDKSVFLNEEVVGGIFSKLNLVQIKQLVSSFTPDEYAPGERGEVSDAVLQALEGHAFKSNDKTLELNPNKFITSVN